MRRVAQDARLRVQSLGPAQTRKAQAGETVASERLGRLRALAAAEDAAAAAAAAAKCDSNRPDPRLPRTRRAGAGGLPTKALRGPAARRPQGPAPSPGRMTTQGRVDSD